MEIVKKLWSEETGQGMTEYGLIIGIVAIFLIVGLVAFRTKLVEIFASITGSTALPAAPAQ